MHIIADQSVNFTVSPVWPLTVYLQNQDALISTDTMKLFLLYEHLWWTLVGSCHVKVQHSTLLSSTWQNLAVIKIQVTSNSSKCSIFKKIFMHFSFVSCSSVEGVALTTTVVFVIQFAIFKHQFKQHMESISNNEEAAYIKYHLMCLHLSLYLSILCDYIRKNL